MLNLIKSKTKKFICCFVLCLGVLVSAFAGYNISKPDMVMAKSTNKIVEDVTSTVFGTGYNFYTSSTSDEPVSPNGWTKLESEASSNHADIIKGVVNVEDETSFDTDECGTSRPSMPIVDKDTTNDTGYYNNLMINATEKSGPAKFGYRNSSAITLEEDSFYRISVLIYTQQTDEIIEKDDEDNDVVVQEETDPRASIYLTGLVDEDDELYSQTKYEYFSTLGAWEEYYFYIDTNESKTVYLQLWLGSKTSPVQGAVFFNNVSIIRYSEDAYIEQTSNLTDNNNDNHNIISLRSQGTTPFANSDFEDVTLGGWTRLVQSTSNPEHQLYKSVDANSFSRVNDDLTITAPGTNCSYDNTLALFMYNKVDGYQAIESEPITINKQTYYKMTFWAKSDAGTTATGATVKLVDKTEENPIDSATLTTSTTVSNNSNKFRNDWTKYTFYIYGPATGSKTITTQIWLGTQDSKSTGYVFIDDFKIETVDYETYNNNQSNNNTTTFNLNNGEDKYLLANADFDKVETSNSDTLFPANPKDWTKSGSSSSTTFSGVINTSKDSFDNIDFPNGQVPSAPKALPNTTETDNNVLMIGSVDERNTQTYTSATYDFSADTYFAVSFYVMTDYTRNIDNQNYGARVKIASTNYTVFDYYNIFFTDNNWHKVEVRVKTGKNSITPAVNLMFENTNGFVFFDKVEMKTLSEALYNNTSLLDRDTEYHYVDLSKENFKNNSYNKYNTAVNGTETPDNWTVSTGSTNTEFVNSGIITSDNDIIAELNPSISGNTSYLYISSLSDAYFGYTSSQSYTFNSETYYKISVNVLTRYLDKEDEKDDSVNYGASIKLADSTEIMLCGIDTDGKWATYTIYASFTESLTSKITLALGYVDQIISGEVLFDNLVIEEITEDKYIEEYDTADPNKIATFIDYTEPKDEEEDEDDSTWSSEFDWVLLPSILTGLAIIISVVGFYARKIKFNRKPRVKTNYDRRKTLDKDIDRREKIALRQQIISELNAEITSIDKELEEFNIQASKQLEEIKAQIKAEQEELEKVKLEIEIRKKEATAAREKQLKETPDFVADKKAEKVYNNFITKLDKQELSVQKKIVAKELKISATESAHEARREKYIARQEYIRAQIAKIEAEIEEIAKQEAEIWAEYKAAKADAKRRKAEYKAQVKTEKEKAKKQKTANKNTTAKTATTEKSSTSKKTTAKKTTKSTEKKTAVKKIDKKDNK